MVIRATGAHTSGSCIGGDGHDLLDRLTTVGSPLTGITMVGGRWVVQSRTDTGHGQEGPSLPGVFGEALIVGSTLSVAERQQLEQCLG